MYTGTLIDDLFAVVERVRERAEKSALPRPAQLQPENHAPESAPDSRESVAPEAAPHGVEGA